MDNLAVTLGFMGRDTEAEDLLRQTLEIQRSVLGPDHPETARIIYNLSCFGARQGRRDEALLLLSEAIDHLPPRTLAKVETDPDLSSLHGDSRFDALVARAGQQTITARKPN
jgi:tetratricopeptide repeat protein